MVFSCVLAGGTGAIGRELVRELVACKHVEKVVALVRAPIADADLVTKFPGIDAGLAESMLAGAAAKEGKSVLHLDAAECYGGAWGVLNLDSSTSGTSHGWNLPTGSPDPARGAQGTTADGTANGEAVEVEQTLNLC